MAIDWKDVLDRYNRTWYENHKTIKDLFYYLHHEKGTSFDKMAVIFSVDRASIRTHFHKLNIPVHNKGWKLKQPKSYHIAKHLLSTKYFRDNRYDAAIAKQFECTERYIVQLRSIIANVIEALKEDGWTKSSV